MPNQQNFPDKLVSFQDQRPLRVSQKDLTLVQQEDAGVPREKNVVFGTTLKDNIEIYVYDELNQVVAHTNLRPDDPAVRLLTFAPNETLIGRGQDSTPDNLQIDLVTVLGRFGLLPGRYSITLNFFRDEVGSEFVDDQVESPRTGPKLFIADISPSRTELRLQPIRSRMKMVNEITEWVDPSVPSRFAQALIDQTFGVSLDATLGESITLDKVEREIASQDVSDSRVDELSTASRVAHAGLEGPYASFIMSTYELVRNKTLDELAARVDDPQVQDSELQELIATGIRQALEQLVSSGQLDPKFRLIGT
jgi:hypothetical protein